MKPEVENFLKEKKSAGDYTIHLNDYVEVITSEGHFLGKLIFTNYETTLLCPSLVNKSIGDTKKFVIKSDRPTQIFSPKISTIAPSERSYLENIINHHKVHPEKEFKK